MKIDSDLRRMTLGARGADWICGGRPTFKYTRIEVAGVLDRLAAGEPLDDVISGYRGRVSHEAVMEAIRVVTDGYLLSLPALEPA